MISMKYGGGEYQRNGSAGGGGGGLTLDELWSNNSPTSSFAAQTVQLSAPVTNYKLLMITYYFATSQTELQTVIFPVGPLYSGGETGRILTNGATTNRTGGRTFTVPSANSVAFGGASWNTGTANGYCVPVAIYGIR